MTVKSLHFYRRITISKYTEQQLRDAISSSRSIRQSLIALGLVGEGGNYRIIHRAIAKYKIDISHFTQQGWAKGQTLSPKRPLQAYLCLDAPTIINSHALKRRMLKEGLFEHRCSNCLLDTWLDKPIPLELDHINGAHHDNRIHNLRLLCPNCHSLTPTYRGRKKSYT